MVYAYDQWAQMPVKDLFDTQMMLASVEAAKDMYEKGLAEMKDFRKEYGDFYTPIQAQQDWYNENFNISKLIDDLYSRGIDPVRSAEGRTAIRRYINSRDYGTLNQLRMNSALAQEYLKNRADLEAKGLYNPEFEQFAMEGKTLENWGMQPWTRTSPYTYQDLNQYTGHIFDNLKDSFIESDPKTGLDWFGVSRDQREEALTQQMGGLLNTPLGKWHYQQSVNNFVAEHGRQPNEAEAMQQFKNDILTATREYEHRTYKENPMFEREMDYIYANKLDASKAERDYKYYKLKKDYDGMGNTGKENPYSYKMTLQNSTISQASGTSDPNRQGSFIRQNLVNIVNTAINAAGLDENNHFFTINVPQRISNVFTGEQAKPYITKSGKTFVNGVINRLLVEDDKQSFPEQMGGAAITGTPFKGAMAFDYNSHAHLLHSPEDLVTHMYGFHGGRINTSTELFKNGRYAVIPLGYALGHLDRDKERFTNQKYVKIVKQEDDGTISLSAYNSAPIMFMRDESLDTESNAGKAAVDFSVSERAIPRLQATDIRTNKTMNVGNDLKSDISRSGTEIGNYSTVENYNLIP